jgi:amidophosphoribosyltransferase
VEETARAIGADSLSYLSLGSLSDVLNRAGCPICDACFSGDYPIPPPAKAEKNIFDRHIARSL